MRETPTQASYTRLELGDTSTIPVGVTVSPHISLVSMLVEVVGGYDRGLPGPWRRQVGSAIPEQGYRAASALARRGTSVQPDFIVPISPTEDASAVYQAEMLRDLTEADVLKGIEEVFGDRLPAQWRQAADQPRRWVASLADAFTATRVATENLWTKARPLLDREIERIGVASVRGGTDAVLGLLRPHFRFSNGSLLLPDAEPARYTTRGRKLILVPMLAGGRSVVSNFDEEDAIWIAYPLPGLDGLLENGRSEARPGVEGLDLVVGAHRAKLLRHLGKPARMGEIANLLSCAASTATYHCEQLVSAGLIQRHREGQVVLVVRTPRGDALVDLLA
ncbi:transcriptional regulator [Amycolatopsis orientalis]|uniref:Transcriptional regulator n=1 Tax=Amycolatopsis orientalis TaxID=31958 RepID=A0A193C5V0_AMYOR|nr:helix-turn-helix domain-containing protein [Amycolatopsis orientalis]ANN19956.1 transcriptional regulator [Amycolatopsis orientalis]